jgi:glycosyltransferase involved in cell wall biosynthesis
MYCLAEALAGTGVSARLWRPWEDTLADADLLHLFGTSEEFLPVVEAARQRDVKVVLTPQVWRDVAEQQCVCRSTAQKMAAWAGKLGQMVCPAWSWRRRLYRSVDLLLPHSNLEAQRLMRRYRLPAERIRVVPHGVESRFAQADPAAFVPRRGAGGFILCAGPVQPRGHQLPLLLAMGREDVPLVILGDAAARYPWYMAECRRVAGPGVQFLPEIGRTDPLLAAAYAAAGCVVVAGGREASERIALEAGMSGSPLVLFESGCGQEYFGHQAVYVESSDVPGIRRGVRTALERGRNQRLAEHVRTYFSWTAVARVMREAYAKILRPRNSPANGSSS